MLARDLQKALPDTGDTKKLIEQLVKFIGFVDSKKKAMLNARVRRTSSVIPFGYVEGEQGWLEPVPEELEALVEAEKYAQTCSYREVSSWVERKTGRYISARGLQKRLDRGIFMVG